VIRPGWLVARVLAGWLLLVAAAPPALADELKIGGTGGALGAMRLIGDAFTALNPDIRVTVLPSLGSGGGIKAAIRGAVDVAVASRPLTDAERKAGASSTEYARTPFVFAVAEKSPVGALTLDQLADIYAGRVAKWADGMEIRLVLRPIGDADSLQVKAMSAKLNEAKTMAEKRPGMAFAITDQDAADDIARIPGALGPTTLALIVSEKRPLRPLKLDGVEPSLKNLAAGLYRHSRTMTIVTGSKSSPAAQKFVAFVRSPAGRDILVRAGNLPL